MKLSGTTQILIVITVIFIIFCFDKNIVSYLFAISFGVTACVSYHVDKQWWEFQQREKLRSEKLKRIVIKDNM